MVLSMPSDQWRSGEDPNERIIFSPSSTRARPQRVLGRKASPDADLTTGPAIAFGEAARTHLPKETTSALDDLECGKEFHPMFCPKQTPPRARVNAERGQ